MNLSPREQELETIIGEAINSFRMDTGIEVVAVNVLKQNHGTFKLGFIFDHSNSVGEGRFEKT